MISELNVSNCSLGGFPAHLEDPKSYYEGVDVPGRVICCNVIVFERLTRKALQQQHLANRMHHRYVLIRVLQTPGVVSVDGQSYHLEVGDALLVRPYQFHHFIDLESDRLRWLFITFDLVQGESMLVNLAHHRLQPGSLAHALWEQVVDLWLRDVEAQRAELLPVLDRLLTHLLSSMTVRMTAMDASQSNRKNDWIVQIESLIIQSVREGWTFEQVAQRAGVSERHLRNLFEQQMGLSLREYRSNYQFHTAISLMRDPARSLSDVAELSGFHSQSVFTRFIRRMADRTPRELCRQIREGHFKLEEP